MLRLLCLLGLVAFCAAKYDHCCSAADRHAVQHEWDELWHDVESAKLKIGFGRLALTRLVEKHPELKAPMQVVDLDHPDSGKFSVYSLRVLLAFDNVITLLDDPEALDAALDTMAERWSHREHVTFEHFKDFGHLLNEGLSHLIDDYDPLAWRSCFSGIFKKVASRLPGSAH